jgi:hypothetical protein
LVVLIHDLEKNRIKQETPKKISLQVFPGTLALSIQLIATAPGTALLWETPTEFRRVLVVNTPIAPPKKCFNALHDMYGTYEGVTLCGKPSGTTYDLIKDIISCSSKITYNHYTHHSQLWLFLISKITIVKNKRSQLTPKDHDQKKQCVAKQHPTNN